MGSPSENGKVSHIFKRYQEGGQLTPAELSKILHLVPENETPTHRSTILAAQQGYWSEWGTFRCSKPGRFQLRHFERVVGLLPVKKEFGEFVAAGPKTVVIDLGSGPASMQEHLGQILAYVAIDNNDHAIRDAKTKLKGNNHMVVKHDFSRGLPDSLEDYVKQKIPEEIVGISNWAATYLDADAQIKLLTDCFELGKKCNVPVRVCINMITNGEFDPKVLAQKFKEEVVPQNKGKRLPLLVMAGMSMNKMKEFGRTFKEVSPIWYPDELIELWEMNGFKIGRTNPNLLWGQSTAVEIVDKSATLK